MVSSPHQIMTDIHYGTKLLVARVENRVDGSASHHLFRSIPPPQVY